MASRSHALALLLAIGAVPVAAQAGGEAGGAVSEDAAEWIGHPDPGAIPQVLQFRRAFTLDAVPTAFPVRVSADNAFTLYVNGQRVVTGPSTSDTRHWRYSSIDLAPFLKPGANLITASVWNFVKPQITPPPQATPEQRQQSWEREMGNQTGRLAQQSLATGFWLSGTGAAAQVTTGRDHGGSNWEVALDPSHVPGAGSNHVGIQRYYVASAPEIIDTRLAPGAQASTWVHAIAVPAARRPLIADPLPHQRFAEVPSGMVVETTFSPAGQFPARPVTFPAHSSATFLIQRPAMISAYPEWQIEGGRGARIRVTYSEAPYDAEGHKGDRDRFEGAQFIGIHDDIIADGTRRSVLPLWWRTWRYAQVTVDTADAPLTLAGLRTWETGYPFEEKGYFRSSDPELDRIWAIGWRTSQVDAHDTYMDSAYWEQLQYVGDTRLQMLISYAVSGDARLAAQAIDVFAQSDVDNGLVEGAWPSRGTNSIAPFSLLWVGMLRDWMEEQPDRDIVVRNLPRVRRILDWFVKWQGPDGLLRKNPQWNFIDWVGQGPTDRTRYPSYSKNGESCLTSILYLGALDQAADIEAVYGDAAQGKDYRARAVKLRQSLRARCYSPQRQLYADNPDLTVFSQQMNALAVLYDVARPKEARGLLDRIVVPGKGIDAPAGMYASSYYFAWYLIRAFEHAGTADRYVDLLQTWRALLKFNYTTWPEERDNTRSDTHAWSAHPTADLLRLIAGIGPGAPGFSQLRVAPAPGALTRLDAAAMTPKGLVSVRYRRDGKVLQASVTRPDDLPGWLEWQGRRYPLTGVTTKLALPIPAKRGD